MERVWSFSKVDIEKDFRFKRNSSKSIYPCQRTTLRRDAENISPNTQNLDGFSLCIKELRKEKDKSKAISREINVLQSMKHENVMRLLDIYENTKFVFYIVNINSPDVTLLHWIINTNRNKKNFSSCATMAQDLCYQLLSAVDVCNLFF